MTDGAGPGAAPPPTLHALTGIRAVAALAVVVFHIRQPLFALVPSAHVLDPWFMFGFLGVDVFFVLSGFILSHNYAERLTALSGREYGSFLRARFARIYPVHLVTLLAIAALLAAFAARGQDLNPAQEHTALGFVGNLLLLQAFPGVGPWNGASWSVSCEAVAYVLFPFVAGYLLRLGRVTARALAVALVVLQLAAIELLSQVPGFFPFSWVRLAGEFTLGCVLWAAWRHGGRVHRLGDAVASGSVVVALVLLAAAKPWLAVPFLALFVVATASSRGPVRALLASRPMEWGGRVSYSLFLTHIPVIVVMFVVLPPDRFSAASPAVRAVVLAAYAVAMVTVAAAVHRGVEEPWRRRIRGPRRPVGAERTSGPSPVVPPSSGTGGRVG